MARARVALGGGDGSSVGGEGGGGGAAVRLEPLGWIRIDHDDARWEPIRDPARLLAGIGRLAVGLGLGLFLVFKGIAAMAR